MFLNVKSNLEFFMKIKSKFFCKFKGIKILSFLSFKRVLSFL